MIKKKSIRLLAKCKAPLRNLMKGGSQSEQMNLNMQDGSGRPTQVCRFFLQSDWFFFYHLLCIHKHLTTYHLGLCHLTFHSSVLKSYCCENLKSQSVYADPWTTIFFCKMELHLQWNLAKTELWINQNPV